MKRKAGAENPPRAQGRLGRNLSRGFGAGILPGRALSPIIAMSEPGRWRNSSRTLRVPADARKHPRPKAAILPGAQGGLLYSPRPWG